VNEETKIAIYMGKILNITRNKNKHQGTKHVEIIL
jgi:hypothetical protein